MVQYQRFLATGARLYRQCVAIPYRGPGQNQWDLAAFKNVVIREKVSLQVRNEFYNAFNRAQWSMVNSAAQFNTAGQQVNSLFGKVTADRGPRIIQLALWLTF